VPQGFVVPVNTSIAKENRYRIFHRKIFSILKGDNALKTVGGGGRSICPNHRSRRQPRSAVPESSFFRESTESVHRIRLTVGNEHGSLTAKPLLMRGIEMHDLYPGLHRRDRKMRLKINGVTRYVDMTRLWENSIASKRKLSKDYSDTGWQPVSEAVWKGCREKYESPPPS
jgi:hypothetical protein